MACIQQYWLYVHTCAVVSSSRYDNTGGGAIEVISPASSPVQLQQDKPEDGQQQAAGMNTNSVWACEILLVGA